MLSFTSIREDEKHSDQLMEDRFYEDLEKAESECRKQYITALTEQSKGYPEYLLFPVLCVLFLLVCVQETWPVLCHSFVRLCIIRASGANRKLELLCPL